MWRLARTGTGRGPAGRSRCVNGNEIGEMECREAALPTPSARHKISPPAAGKPRQVTVIVVCSNSLASSDQITVQTLTAASSRPSNPIQTSALKATDVSVCGSLTLLRSPGLVRCRGGEIFTQKTVPTNRVSSSLTIAWKASLTCRPVTDLHARPRFSNRADQKSRGRRDGIRNTRGAAARNGIDFTLRGWIRLAADMKPGTLHDETARF